MDDYITVPKGFLDVVDEMREWAGQYAQLYEPGDARNSVANNLAFAIEAYDAWLRRMEKYGTKIGDRNG